MQSASPSLLSSAENGSGTMLFARVTSAADLDDARQLRQRMYAKHYAFDLAEQGDGPRDAMGHVFLARSGATPVATVRLLPLTSGVSEVESLGLLPPGAVSDDPHLAEGGRLAALPRRGPGASYGLLMQVWSAQWLRHHTPLRRWLAWCRRDVLPIHLRVGAEVLAGPFPVAALGPGEFYIVGSSFETLVERAVTRGCGSVARVARSCTDGRGLVPDRDRGTPL